MSEVRERIYGLDICRIGAMVMITLLHLVNQHCGLLNENLPGWQYFAGCFLEYACFAGVNCFAMLTGYTGGGKIVSYDKKWLGRLFSLWIKIICWWFLLFLLCKLVLFPDKLFFSAATVFNGLLSPADGTWWYISAYFPVLLFMPLLNRGLNGLNGGEKLRLAAVLFVLFSVLPAITGDRGFLGVDSGYSALWLIVCMVYGAVLRDLQPAILRIKRVNIYLWLTVLATILLPCGFHLAAIHPDIRRFMSFNSPFCVLEAAALLLLCVQIRVRSGVVQKVITFISVNSLGIYLLQCYPAVWENFICRQTPEVSPAGAWWYIPVLTVFLTVSGVIGSYLVSGICCLPEKIFYHGRKNEIGQK
jgi:surface polysaccharide O-acyltransferase-like enzyme